MKLRTAIALFALALASPALGQGLHSTLVVSGLKRPVAFVQDPSQPHTQMVVEQGGRIRPVVDGRLLDRDFLDISDIISTNREGGLLGMAFAPDYAASGRFFVNFTDPNDNTVIARFTRMAGDPLRADLATRFDLVWPDGNASIAQPFCCHYGGHLAFGPDGYLYIGLGDGGAFDDPDDNAQRSDSLLGKMLRIDVNVPDSNSRGYVVPGDNPFVGQTGALGEIWAAGLRNPWRYNFDDPALGGTGALIIADVGQDSWEEFEVEPAGRGGRNYGWRNREAAVDYVETARPWFEPLTDPTYSYAHDGGRAIIGGFVYRGRALGPTFAGRYFFGDFMTGQLWTIALTPDPMSGEIAANDLREHTADIGDEPLDYFTAFGQDAAGELYVVSWWHGTVFKIVPGAAPPPSTSNVFVVIDTPLPGSRAQPFTVVGWAVDHTAMNDTGIDYIEVWANRLDISQAPALIGRASRFDRADVAGILGPQFLHSGYSISVRGLKPGRYEIVVNAHSSLTGKFEGHESVVMDVGSGIQVAIDQPAGGATVPASFLISGWGLDLSALTGPGVDAIHVWAFPVSGAPPLWAGAASYGWLRPDVGAVYGPAFTNVGFYLRVSTLPPGQYRLIAYAHSTVADAFTGQGVMITVLPGAGTEGAPSSHPLSRFSVQSWGNDPRQSPRDSQDLASPRGGDRDRGFGGLDHP